MKKLEIVTVVGLITILCMSYLHFRTNAAAQVTDSEVSSLQPRIKGFFDSLATQSNTSDAFQKLFTVSQLQDQRIQDIVLKTEELIKVGTRWRSEFLDTKSVGNDVILIRYLYKNETHPVIWYFTFYRSQSGLPWNCIGIRFDTNFDSLF